MGEGILLGPLVLFAAAMCLTPGPSVVLVTASAANFGFRGALPLIFGITLGFGAMVMAVGLGLAGLFHAEPRLHMRSNMPARSICSTSPGGSRAPMGRAGVRSKRSRSASPARCSSPG